MIVASACVPGLCSLGFWPLLELRVIGQARWHPKGTRPVMDVSGPSTLVGHASAVNGRTSCHLVTLSSHHRAIVSPR